MGKFFLISGAVIGALAVIIGAFGAHGLNDLLERIGRKDVFETAVKYQFYHCFAILVAGFALMKYPLPVFSYAGWCFLAGILIFSGSLYILSTTGIKWLGAVTPVGGLLFIAGWALLVTGFARI